MGEFVQIPISKLFKNIDESAQTSSYAALENAYITEAGGISRFPGIEEFCDIGGNDDIYMSTINNDMIAVKGDGRVYRIDKSCNIEAIQGPQVLGGRRVMFERDEANLYMVAGSQIIAFDGVKTRVLNEDAPRATHLGSMNSYLIANQLDTNKWGYSSAAKPEEWPALNIFAAISRPGPITSLITTEFNEIIVGKQNSIEQYAPLIGGEQPFTWRWTIGDGISEPYTLIFHDNAVWGLNNKHEFTRLSGQTGQVMSSDIQKDLEEKYDGPRLDSFEDAWAAPFSIKGQNFILVQMPKASNIYGGKGCTYLFDVRQNKWSELYGWNPVDQLPAVWPGSSVMSLWGRTYVGGRGKIYQVTDNEYKFGTNPQRFFVRTAHFAELGLVRMDSMRITMKRGVGSYTENPRFFMRVNRNRDGFGKWQSFRLGLSGRNEFQIFPGAQGEAYTWQFEFMTTDDCQIEIRKIEAEVTQMVR